MSLSDQQTRVLWWLGVALLLAWVVYVLSPVLLPFAVAWAIAYVLRPGVDALAARRWPRVVAVALVLLLFAGMLVALAWLVVPVLTQLLPALREQVPDVLARAQTGLTPWAARMGVTLNWDIEAVRTGLQRLLAGHEGQVMERVLASVRIGGSLLLAVVGNVVLMPLLAFYLLLDWHTLMPRVRAWIPPRWRGAFDSFVSDADAMLRQYLSGQWWVMAWLALFYTVALSLLGLDLAVPIGLFTGLAVFVPYVGYGLGLVLAVVAAVLQFHSGLGVLGVLGVYGVGQVLEGFYLTPRLLGERIGLHPVAVIFAMMAFGQLWGFAGLLLALPGSAVLLVALRRVRLGYRRSGLYRTPPGPRPRPSAPEETEA